MSVCTDCAGISCRILLYLLSDITLARRWRRYGAMSTAREFIDFWIENSVHARELYGTAGASQDVTELTRRCIDAAKGQRISEADLQAEIGDVATYILDKLRAANKAESDRRRPT